MSKLLTISAFIIVSLVAFFNAAEESFDIRSEAQEKSVAHDISADEVVNNLKIKSAKNAATISFETLGNFNTRLKLGTSEDLLKESHWVNKDPNTTHKIEVGNLEKGMRYYFLIEIQNKYGFSGATKVYNFRTRN